MKRLLTAFLLCSCACGALSLAPGGFVSFAPGGYLAIVGVNPIPPTPPSQLNALMTSDTAPAPNAVTYAHGTAGWQAFDGDLGTKYVDAMPQTIGYINYDFGVGNTALATSFKMKFVSGKGPKTYGILGSQNAAAWDTLKTGTTTNDESLNEYTFTNTTPYRYYRLEWTDTWTMFTPAEIYEVQIW